MKSNYQYEPLQTKNNNLIDDQPHYIVQKINKPLSEESVNIIESLEQQNWGVEVENSLKEGNKQKFEFLMNNNTTKL